MDPVKTKESDPGSEDNKNLKLNYRSEDQEEEPADVSDSRWDDFHFEDLNY